MMKPIVRQGLKIKEWQPTKAWLLAILWLLVIGFLAFFWNLGSTGLIDETEPLFAEAARQMTVTGDWITPYFNGVTRFDKPPLIYWLMAIAYSTFGVNEFAARLPSALAGVALTSLLFYTLRQFGGWGIPNLKPTQDATKSDNTAIRQWQSWLVAGLGSAMVALNPLTLFFGRTGYSDMLLSLCFGGSLLAFFSGYAQPEQPKIQERWYLAVYVLFGLAVLTKGPVGIVLPGLIIASFLFFLGKTKEVLREMQVVRGAIIFLVIAVPWYILVTLQNGEKYIDSFFGVHNIERFTQVVNHHQGPIYFHILIVLIGFAPWSIGLPSAILSIKLQRQRWQNLPRQAHLGLFALFWFVIVLGFFTIAVTKYFSYTLPLMPAAAILLALWWSEQVVQEQIFHQSSLSLKITAVVNIVFFAVLAVACFYCPQWLGNDSTMPNLGLRISQSGISNIGAVIWGISAIAGLILLLRRQAYWLCSVQFLGFLAFLMFAIIPASAIIDSERQLPLRQIAQAVVQDAKPGEETVMIDNGFEKPTLVFYSQRPITFLMRPTETIPYIQNTNKKTSSKSLLLIATEQALTKTGLEKSQYQAVSQSGIYQLVRVLKTRIQ